MEKKDQREPLREHDRQNLEYKRDERVTFRELDRQFWENWLPPAELSDRLTHIRRFVKHLYETKEDIPQIPYFTPHGIEHCQAVEDIIHKLIPGKRHEKLGESEKFFLLGSAWLHDIGMLRGIFSSDELNKDENQIRDDHHTRSEQYLISKYREVGVKEFEAPAFAFLARFHRRRCPLKDCPEYLPIPEHGSIRLRLLAAYLRLADALHVDQTRAPAQLYAILLTYNIPTKSKMHWLRSKFVLGLDIDVKNKAITVHLKYPIHPEKIANPKLVKRTLTSIYNNIVQDLTDELDSVKNELFSANISYFLSINKEKHKIEFGDQFCKDIRSVFNYYDLLDNPSSSALFYLVLESIQGIVDSHPLDETDQNSFAEESLRNSINLFLNEISSKVLKTRTCHTGLRNLVHEIRRKLGKDFSTKTFKMWLDFKSLLLKQNRKNIRLSAFRYFSEIIKKDNFTIENGKVYNILLYGYSELVAKTLCGFRDAVIFKLLNKQCEESEKLFQKSSVHLSDEGKIFKDYCEAKERSAIDQTEFTNFTEKTFPNIPFFHKAEIEKKASDFFQIFCCEGQPKNHTAWGGRIIYHDGIRYAIALTEKLFSKIYVIPDAAAPSLINGSIGKGKEMPTVDFIVVGANGFDNELFIHSAGHTMVVNSACASELRNKPTVILSVMTDKYDNGCVDPCIDLETQKLESDIGKITEGGWNFKGRFKGEYSVPRRHSFFCQDPSYQDRLNNDAPNVLFYNPREDRVCINLVDVVITEKAFQEKRAFEKNDLEKNWNGEAIKSRNDDAKFIIKTEKSNNENH